MILLSVILVLYFIGGLIWNERAFKLYQQKVSEPWSHAIAMRDWEAVEVWRATAHQFPLQKWEYMLNPVAWFRYWNWQP